MTAIDLSSPFGILLEGVIGMTGSLFLALLTFISIIILLCLAFRLPLEITAPVILPFLIATMVMTSEVLPVFGAFAIYLSMLLAKNFFLNN